jgi:anti-sigma regulatory factor (Ser/Thr protein kinase)
LLTSVEPLGEPVWVDQEMIEKILASLLSNALKFTFAGEIEVTLRRLPKHAELVVRDTGVGIPEEEAPEGSRRHVTWRCSIYPRPPGGRLRVARWVGPGPRHCLVRT